MKVEVLIYSYLVVCTAMICFNIACIFVFRYKDKKLDKYSKIFTNKIKEQIELQSISELHKNYLSVKLKRINNLIAFDKTISNMYEEQPDDTYNYIIAVSSVFVDLTPEYLKKNEIQSAYFTYIIKKYRLFRGQENKIVFDSMLELVGSSSLYCRENALLALYSMGNAKTVEEALCILDECGYYHNPKLITDGLLGFSGDKDELSDLLWQRLNSFSQNLRIAVLDYFRFSSDKHCERMLELLKSTNLSDETAYRCIRYFGKYRYEPAYPFLIEFAQNDDEIKWEYSAISASALENYPSEKTIEVLTSLLFSKNWYVRYNASQSLEKLGADYVDLIDVFESDDRYAADMMRYRFDKKRMREKELKAYNE